MNKMKELAGIFSKELGEEFNIIDDNGNYLEYNPYKFTDKYLVDTDGDGAASEIVMGLITGDYTIEKVPFTPKIGEEYYTYYFSCNDSPFNGRVLTNRWEGSPVDKMNKLLGIVFRTEKEAKDYLPTFKRRLEGEEV